MGPLPAHIYHAPFCTHPPCIVTVVPIPIPIVESISWCKYPAHIPPTPFHRRRHVSTPLRARADIFVVIVVFLIIVFLVSFPILEFRILPSLLEIFPLLFLFLVSQINHKHKQNQEQDQTTHH